MKDHRAAGEVVQRIGIRIHHRDTDNSRAVLGHNTRGCGLFFLEGLFHEALHAFIQAPTDIAPGRIHGKRGAENFTNDLFLVPVGGPYGQRRRRGSGKIRRRRIPFKAKPGVHLVF